MTLLVEGFTDAIAGIICHTRHPDEFLRRKKLLKSVLLQYLSVRTCGSRQRVITLLLPVYRGPLHFPRNPLLTHALPPDDTLQLTSHFTSHIEYIRYSPDI